MADVNLAGISDTLVLKVVRCAIEPRVVTYGHKNDIKSHPSSHSSTQPQRHHAVAFVSHVAESE